MERRELLVAAAAMLPATAIRSTAHAAPLTSVPRTRELLDDGWRFHLGHAADIERDFGWGRNQRSFAKAGVGTADAAMPKFDDSGWSAVQVPHDWVVDLPYAPPATPAPENTRDAVAAHGFKAVGRAHPANSIGWYRRSIEVGPEDAKRRLWLEFDGVFRDCLVFVNGYVVGRNESGYTPFKVDLSDFLDYSGGPNVIAVRADATLGEGWFYEGAGIYRNVHLVRAAPVHIPQWGTFVRSDVGPAGARIDVTTEVVNDQTEPAEVLLRQRIVDPDGRTVAELPDATLRLAGENRGELSGATSLAAPQLWSIDTPRLYTLTSELVVQGEVVDRYETSFGIRTIRFDAQRGFLLNGKPVKLLGVCNHHDHAGVGAGIPDALHRWRVQVTRDMGANAWRSAHNPAATSLLETCDRMGMLMIDEARLNSTDAEAMDQLERLVRRGRNHPSIIAWSVGNEEPHQGSARGARISAEMVRRVKALDPTRPTTQAFDNAFDGPTTMEVDVVGFNYRTDKMEPFHAKFPDKPVMGTETASTVSTRGEYVTDEARHTLRAYDTEHPWWATTSEAWWTIVEPRPYIAGGFIWTGFDYRGEPTPYPAWPSVSSYFGVMDLCGFPKDNYWYYRAWWRPEPLVHLFPHWNWAGKEGQDIEVWVHSNCDEVELLLNGRSLGRKKVERGRHLAWMVPYAAGAIEARGFRAGRRAAVARRETTGAPAAVRLIADRRTLAGDGRDVSMIRAEIVDARGRIVPNGNARLRFDVAGPARVIGVGNGDPTSHEPDRATVRSAFNGLAQAIVQSSGGAGPVRVTATADGLAAGTVALLAGAPR
ncbi:MAG TPA: beta-galactosidase GalA [Sphingomonas sp.]|nr:beta-galactosidase GalA [Sphingomonas sp.]